MNVTVIQEKILSAIQHVEKVVSKNLSLPILSKVLMIVEENNVTLRSTNLHVGVEVTLPAKTEETGTVAFDGGVFATILSHSKQDKNVTLVSEEGNIRVNTERASTLLKSYQPDDFPTIPKIENPTTFSTSLESFINGLKAVVYASAISDIKPEIASVYMYPLKHELVFVTTDSFRLAEKKIKVENLPEFEGILIPIKNVQDIIKVFSGDKENVEIQIGQNQLSLITENIHMTSQLIDGVFPDYQQIIPKDFNTVVTALSSDVLQAVRMTNIFADKFNQVDITVNSEEKYVAFASRNADVGENMTKIDAALSGEGLITSINHRYLSDVFQSITTDSLTINFVSGNKPLIISGVGDGSFQYLIMPMNR